MERPRFGLKETIAANIYLLPIAVALMADVFSWELKQQVRKEQKGVCADCGSKTHLEVHHKVPQSRRGADIRENAVGLCGPDMNDCHEKWDRLALQNRIVYPGIPIEKAPRTLFKRT